MLCREGDQKLHLHRVRPENRLAPAGKTDQKVKPIIPSHYVDVMQLGQVRHQGVLYDIQMDHPQIRADI